MGKATGSRRKQGRKGESKNGRSESVGVKKAGSAQSAGKKGSPPLKLPTSSSPQDEAKRALLASLLSEEAGVVASAVTALSDLAQKMEGNEVFFVEAVPALVKFLEKDNVNPKQTADFLSILQDLTSTSKQFSTHFLNAAGHISLLTPLKAQISDSGEAASSALQILLALLEDFNQALNRHLPEKSRLVKELQKVQEQLQQQGKVTVNVKIPILVVMILQELQVSQSFPAHLVKLGFASGDSKTLDLTLTLLARYLEDSEEEDGECDEKKGKKGTATPMEIDDDEEPDGIEAEMEDQSSLQELAPFFNNVLHLVLEAGQSELDFDKTLNLLSLFIQRGLADFSVESSSSKQKLLLEKLLALLEQEEGQSPHASAASTALRCLLPLLKKGSDLDLDLSSPIIATKLEEIFFKSQEEDVKVNLLKALIDLRKEKDLEPLGLFFLKALSTFEKNPFYLNCEVLDGLMDSFGEDEAAPLLLKLGLLRRLQGVRGELRKAGRGWRAQILEEERVAVVETVFENIGAFLAWAEKETGSSK